MLVEGGESSDGDTGRQAGGGGRSQLLRPLCDLGRKLRTLCERYCSARKPPLQLLTNLNCLVKTQNTNTSYIQAPGRGPQQKQKCHTLNDSGEKEGMRAMTRTKRLSKDACDPQGKKKRCVQMRTCAHSSR